MRSVGAKLAATGIVLLLLGFAGFIWFLPAEQIRSIAPPTASWS